MKKNKNTCLVLLLLVVPTHCFGGPLDYLSSKFGSSSKKTKPKQSTSSVKYSSSSGGSLYPSASSPSVGSSSSLYPTQEPSSRTGSSTAGGRGPLGTGARDIDEWAGMVIQGIDTFGQQVGSYLDRAYELQEQGKLNTDDVLDGCDALLEQITIAFEDVEAFEADLGPDTDEAYGILEDTEAQVNDAKADFEGGAEESSDEEYYEDEYYEDEL